MVTAFDFLTFLPIRLLKESDLQRLLIIYNNFILDWTWVFVLKLRQKRILIGENYYFIDLLFYHRVFKMHVLVRHWKRSLHMADIGQLNTYSEIILEKILAEKSDSSCLLEFCW